MTIWRGTEESHRFSHHPNLVVWRGALHLIWSNGLVHEDSPGQRIPDGTLVASFRTQTGHLHASLSSDAGRTWTNPVSTDFPAATARFYAGNLPDGAAVLINNPLQRGDRSLLTIAISRDGVTFDRAWLVRGEPTGMSHTGRHKLDGWQYPNALVWGDHLL